MRVVVADDSVLLREGVVRLLEEKGFDVVAQAGDAEDLIRKVNAHKPDVAIVDIRMPPTNTDDGLRAALEIRAALPETGVLVLSQYVEEGYALELVGDSAGGVGYLLKDRVADVDRFVDSVRRVAEGGSALDPEVVSQLVGRARRDDPLGELTPREREVLELMAEGRSNNAIADPYGRDRTRSREARDEHLREARPASRPRGPQARAGRARVPAGMSGGPVSHRGVVRRRRRVRIGGRDMAIDLGTANTLVYVRGEGIRVSEPSVVAVDTRTDEVHAVGEEAQRMIGRTPASISAVRPLRHGVITDFEVTEAMLRHFIGRVHKSRFAHPRLVMCAPSGITDVERRALVEACLGAGARSVQLIEEPMAAAIGAELPIEEPMANVVVDIGGGTSEVAVISLGGIVVSRSLRVGGYDFDDAVAGWIRRHHRLAIGETTSEAVKREVGGVAPDETEAVTEVRGRDPVSGLPREAAINSAEMREALEPLAVEILDSVKDALENTPPELAADLTRHGILLAGGGALLAGFRERLELETGVPVRLADDPLTCVALGAGRAIEEIEVLERAVI